MGEGDGGAVEADVVDEQGVILVRGVGEEDAGDGRSGREGRDRDTDRAPGRVDRAAAHQVIGHGHGVGHGPIGTENHAHRGSRGGFDVEGQVGRAPDGLGRGLLPIKLLPPTGAHEGELQGVARHPARHLGEGPRARVVDRARRQVEIRGVPIIDQVAGIGRRRGRHGARGGEGAGGDPAHRGGGAGRRRGGSAGRVRGEVRQVPPLQAVGRAVVLRVERRGIAMRRRLIAPPRAPIDVVPSLRDDGVDAGHLAVLADGDGASPADGHELVVDVVVVGVAVFHVDVDRQDIHIGVARVARLRQGVPRPTRRPPVAPEHEQDVVQPARVDHVIPHLDPQFLVPRLVRPPEPVSVHLVERSPQHRDVVVLEDLEVIRDLLESGHVGQVEGRPRREDLVDLGRAVGGAGDVHRAEAGPVRQVGLDHVVGTSHHIARVPVLVQDVRDVRARGEVRRVEVAEVAREPRGPLARVAVDVLVVRADAGHRPARDLGVHVLLARDDVGALDVLKIGVEVAGRAIGVGVTG